MLPAPRRCSARPHDRAPARSLTARAAGFVAVASSLAVSLAGCPRAKAPAPAPVAKPATAQAPAPREGTLWLLADVRGTPRTCGCAKELELGGFDRLIPWLHDARQAHGGEGLVLHAGPLFFPEAQSPPDRLEPRRRKAQLVGRLTGQLVQRLTPPGAVPDPSPPAHGHGPNAAWSSPDVGAAGVSAVDLAAAGDGYPALVREAGLPFVTANVSAASGAPAFSPHVVLRTRPGPTGLRVGVFGLTAPGDGDLRVTEPEAAARAQVAALRDRVDLVVLLSDLGLRQTKRLLRKVRGVDLALVGGLGDHPVVSEEADRVGDAYVVSLHREGRWVGEVTARRAGPGPLAPWAVREGAGGATPAGSWIRYRAVALSWTLPQDPKIAGEMARFDESLRALARAHAEAAELPATKPGEATYVGQPRCLQCHEEVAPFARTNPHAKAWRTLDKGGKTFDPDCVRCHVTGYGRPGGALVGHTAGREDVQCEACHGPGSRHVAAAEAGDDAAARAAITAKPDASACGLCHTKHHSPGFDFGTYRAKLLVPGHGAP